jgi:hypothetical protein
MFITFTDTGLPHPVSNMGPLGPTEYSTVSLPPVKMDEKERRNGTYLIYLTRRVSEITFIRYVHSQKIEKLDEKEHSYIDHIIIYS